MKKLFVLIAVLSFVCIAANISYGNQYWAKTFGRKRGDRAVIRQTSDGGYIIAGSSSSGYPSDDDPWVLKLNSGGNVTWKKTYATGDDLDTMGSIQQTSDDGYILACFSVYPSVKSRVLKIDSNGNILWTKSYDIAGILYSIAETTDGGYIVTGWTSSNSYYDAVVLKLTSSGDISWHKIYHNPSSNVKPKCIRQTADEGYILTYAGGYYGVGGVIKLNTTGDIEWAKSFTDLVFLGSIHQTSDGGYVLCAAHFGRYDLSVCKIDSSGNVVWHKTYDGGGFDEGNFIQQTVDGGYIVAGYTDSSGAGGHDALLLSLDENGNVVWQKTYGGSSVDRGDFIQQTPDGGYVVAVATDSFGAGYTDLLVLKLDSNGEIPDCNIMAASNAIVSDIPIISHDVTITTESITAAVSDINIIPQDISVEVSVVCCYDTEDNDYDCASQEEDNCPNHYNPSQADTYPPGGNNLGDVCDCEGNFDCDEDCDGGDAALLKIDFGRGSSNNPCNNEPQCNGDFDCDKDVDGTDAARFKQDFGRSLFSNPCPRCEAMDWCNFPCQITISPASAVSLPLETVQFSANISGDCNSACFNWEVLTSFDSTINSTGLYTANFCGMEDVVVTDNCNEDITDYAVVDMGCIICDEFPDRSCSYSCQCCCGCCCIGGISGGACVNPELCVNLGGRCE